MAQDHSFKVSNGRGDTMATESWREACEWQYDKNVELSHAGAEPIYKIWILDVDGVACIVNTQL